MAESLRDQLLKSGIAKQVRDEKRAPDPAKNRGGAAKGKTGGKGARRSDTGEIDLAKAYAIRAQAEATERRRAEREAAERARIRRERKQKIQQLLQDQVLNKAEANLVRHFEYGGKIRRVHVDADQLAALNEGRLGIVQQAGRYLVVTQSIAAQVRDLDPHQLALLVDPNGKGGTGDDGVPDDLVW